MAFHSFYIQVILTTLTCNAYALPYSYLGENPLLPVTAIYITNTGEATVIYRVIWITDLVPVYDVWIDN